MNTAAQIAPQLTGSTLSGAPLVLCSKPLGTPQHLKITTNPPASIIAELERLMNEAGARWMLPKSDNKARLEGWRGRELAYREALRLLAEAGLARNRDISY
jgi:hypothetical protein